MGDIEKGSFIALPRKGGHSGLHALQTMCPQLGNIVTGFIVTAWLARGRSNDGEVSRSRHHQPSGVITLGSAGPGQHPTWRGFRCLQSSSKILWYCVYLLLGKQDLAPRLLLTVSLWSHPLPPLNNFIAWICPLELREGLGGWMKAASYNQRNGEHRKSLCPGATQGPAGYQPHIFTLWVGGCVCVCVCVCTFKFHSQ